MSATNGHGGMLAGILGASRGGYASCAAERLLAEHPEAAEAYGAEAFRGWRGFFSGRIAELATAASTGHPPLMAGQMRWVRQAFVARGVDLVHLKHAMNALREALAEELPPPCVEVARAHLEAASQALEASGSEVSPLDNAEPDSKGGIAARYLVAILEGNRLQAWQEALAATERFTLAEIHAEILTPALWEIGRLWHRNELMIAQEHFATTTTQLLLPQLAARYERKEPNGKCALAAAVATNSHDIGLRMVADLLELDGWRVILVGADYPDSDLAEAVQLFQVDLLVLSIALATQLDGLRRAVDTIRSRELPTKILAGGLALRQAPDLAIQLGADAFGGSATDAVALARRTVGLELS